MFSRTRIRGSMSSSSDEIQRLKKALNEADTVIIGAGAGLSTAAGFTYSGDRLMKYFPDFVREYRFRDMYTGGFYNFPTPEESWGYWSRYIWINRYMDAPKPVYNDLLDLVKDKDYFVITTNVDHCFQKAGVDKKRLFYTQGDYGLLQCSRPCRQETYDNEALMRKMLLAQGFEIGEGNEIIVPDGAELKMSVPTELLPKCPHCGRPMAMNLRSDDTFVEDAGWHAAADRYADFIRTRRGGKTLFLEIGVGYNTPVIIKYPFWRMTKENPDATYACLNYDDAGCPSEIEKQSICIEGDACEIINSLK